MQKLTPPVGHRGIVSGNSPITSWLFTGTLPRLSNTAKDDPAGPKGRNRGTSRSALKIEDPSTACVVTTRRGFESVEGIALVVMEVAVELFSAILGAS